MRLPVDIINDIIFRRFTFQFGELAVSAKTQLENCIIGLNPTLFESLITKDVAVNSSMNRFWQQ